MAVRNSSETERFSYRQRERMRETDRDGVRARSLTDFSDNVPHSHFLSTFHPVPLVKYTHESEGGNACSQNGNGTITDTKQLSPEAGVRGFDGLPHLIFSPLFKVNLNVENMKYKTKTSQSTLPDTHPCNSNINSINKSHLINGPSY